MKKKQQNPLSPITKKPRKHEGKHGNCVGNDMEAFPFPEITFDAEMLDFDFEFKPVDMTCEPPIIPSHLKPKQKKFLRAFAELPGHVADAARRSGIPRRTVYNWINTDRDFQMALEGIKEIIYDFVMSKLLDNIAKGHLPSIRYFLKTFAKHRGY